MPQDDETISTPSVANETSDGASPGGDAQQHPRRTYANLTQQHLERLAERPDVVVYHPTHDVVFVPWESSRVRRCAMHLVRIARRCATEDEARERVRGAAMAANAPAEAVDATDFEANYQMMFRRLTQPEVARQETAVAIVLNMIEMRGRVERGELTEEEAQSTVGQQTLNTLVAAAHTPEGGR